ncbi:MAG: lipid-A-disaccharide synthase [candidate division Zixibacteria bacterium]|nr:lipid-A-disaccharide synthase [candidate division Zixibacteria bacterium]
MKKRVLISAAEVSGDLHASGLMLELLKIDPRLEFFGLGGDKMAKAGCKLLYHAKQLSFMGFWEVLRNLNFIRRVRKNLLRELDSSPCRLGILVDYPGFNLKLAEELKKRNIPVIYYISPQIWAWGAGRMEKIKRLVEKVIVFFPFEKRLYDQHGVKSDFVGHPALEIARPSMSREEFFRKNNLDPSATYIGLLPGSRLQEIRQHLPVMLETAGVLKSKIGNLQFLIAQAPGIEFDRIKSRIPAAFSARILQHATYDIMAYSRFLIVKSGSGTVEAACIGTPFVVLYKMNPVSFAIARRVVKIPDVAMVNVLAGEKIVPEFIQQDAVPAKIAPAVSDILSNPQRYADMKQKLSQVKAMLASGCAYQKAAQTIAPYLI